MLDSLDRITGQQYTSYFLISGPCAVEDYDTCAVVAERVATIASRLSVPYIFKASYKKANRTRLDSFSSIGIEEALEILDRIRSDFAVPVLTDVHESTEVARVAQVADVLQIPAFLCRQTDLLVAAGESGRCVNVKKGQFMSGAGMAHAVEKVYSTKNENVWLTERGNSFGYQDLIVDMRNIAEMNHSAKAVIIDCTHSVQRPNAATGITGGTPDRIELIARAGIAAGAHGIFIETHPDPSRALSDGANMLPLDEIEGLLERIHRLSLSVREIYG